MRAAVIFEYGTLNGGERSFLAAVPQLKRSGLELVALAPDPSPVAEALRQEGVECLAWQPRSSDGQRASQMVLRQQLAERLKPLSPAVVHANSLSMSRLAGPVLSQLGVPGLGHLRDIVRLSRRAVGDLNHLDRLLAVSRATLNWHVNQGLRADRVRVLYNGVDLQEFCPGPRLGNLHRELDLPMSSLLIGSVGQLGARKGCDHLLSSIGAHLRRWDAHLLLVGERNSSKPEALVFEERLRRAAAAPVCRGRVHFLGRRADVPQLLRELAVLVHAARQEPLGRVLLEAAASGCPVIVTHVGGTEEIFSSAEQAILIAPNDPDTMARSAGGLLLNATLRGRMGAAARQLAVQKFDARQRGAELARHYFETATGSKDRVSRITSF